MEDQEKTWVSYWCRSNRIKYYSNIYGNWTTRADNVTKTQGTRVGIPDCYLSTRSYKFELTSSSKRSWIKVPGNQIEMEIKHSKYIASVTDREDSPVLNTLNNLLGATSRLHHIFFAKKSKNIRVELLWKDYPITKDKMRVVTQQRFSSQGNKRAS